jgi:hypothetical protein
VTRPAGPPARLGNRPTPVQDVREGWARPVIGAALGTLLGAGPGREPQSAWVFCNAWDGRNAQGDQADIFARPLGLAHGMTGK